VRIIARDDKVRVTGCLQKATRLLESRGRLEATAVTQTAGHRLSDDSVALAEF
jgi:hypothetical protein